MNQGQRLPTMVDRERGRLALSLPDPPSRLRGRNQSFFLFRRLGANGTNLLRLPIRGRRIRWLPGSHDYNADVSKMRLHSPAMRSHRGWPFFAMLALCGAACSSSTESEQSNAVELVGTPGEAEFPELEAGEEPDLSVLGTAERAVIEQAEARAEALRTRALEIRALAGTEVRIELVRHGFPIGVAIELRKFQSSEDLEWYSQIASRYFNFAVLESEAKWKVTGPEPGVRDYSQTEPVLTWGEAWDLDIKGHVLVWGNGPPLSSSGVPDWVLERFPTPELSETEREELSGLLEEHVRDSVAQFSGRIPVWDITNETLQPLAQWFIARLGPEVTTEAFGWADEEDPEATLVMNEWISEVFTGIGGPSAPDIRDRLLELRDAGVPVEAIGIQGQFTPATAHLGPGADVSNRTPLDAYARALDTISEAGVPIHVTEINVFTPEDQEVRAAHLSGAMRIWWGHPGVAQFGFWSLWDGVSGKKDYDVGLYDDDKQITPMGKAVMHLLNDRWRTRALETLGTDGRLSLRAAAGDYLVQWTVDDQSFFAEFTLPSGEEPVVMELVGTSE